MRSSDFSSSIHRQERTWGFLKHCQPAFYQRDQETAIHYVHLDVFVGSLSIYPLAKGLFLKMMITCKILLGTEVCIWKLECIQPRRLSSGTLDKSFPP